jgi:DNA anti-recombination protein RmuC
MTAVLIAGLIIVAALVAWVALQNALSQRRTQNVESQMTELRRDLQTMATAQAQSAGQIASIGQSVTQRLDSVTKTLQDGVSQSAQISAQSQAAMANELKNSQQTLGEIQKQLGAVQLAGSQMSQTAETLQNILGGAKTRGSLGEVTLERLLEDCLPKDRYARQHRFSSCRQESRRRHLEKIRPSGRSDAARCPHVCAERKRLLRIAHDHGCQVHTTR